MWDVLLLADPLTITGNWKTQQEKSDEEFKKVIDEIRVRIMELKQRLGKNIEA